MSKIIICQRSECTKREFEKSSRVANLRKSVCQYHFNLGNHIFKFGWDAPIDNLEEEIVEAIFQN